MDADINNYLSKLENVDLDNYYILSNLNNKYVKNNFYHKKFSIINEFFYDLEQVIYSSENIINFSNRTLLIARFMIVLDDLGLFTKKF